jgi:hypothetical protein
MHVMLQPLIAEEWLADPKLRDQGLFSRLLICAPKSLQGTRLHRDPDAADMAAIERFNRHLAGLLAQRARVNADGELEPRALPMSREAEGYWKWFGNELEVRQGENGTLYPIRGMSSKAAEYAARLAAVMGLAENPNLAEIDLALLKRGVALAQWYVDEALRLALEEAVPATTRMAEKLLEWLKGYEGIREGELKLFPLADVYQNGPYGIRDADTAKKIIKVLVDHRFVQPVEGSRKFRNKEDRLTTRREVYGLKAA